MGFAIKAEGLAEVVAKTRLEAYDLQSGHYATVNIHALRQLQRLCPMKVEVKRHVGTVHKFRCVAIGFFPDKEHIELCTIREIVGKSLIVAQFGSRFSTHIHIAGIDFEVGIAVVGLRLRLDREEKAQREQADEAKGDSL